MNRFKGNACNRCLFEQAGVWVDLKEDLWCSFSCRECTPKKTMQELSSGNVAYQDSQSHGVSMINASVSDT